LNIGSDRQNLNDVGSVGKMRLEILNQFLLSRHFFQASQEIVQALQENRIRQKLIKRARDL
jgi:hypothetical protein